MKKILFGAAALSIMITQTGCFGSFGLVKTIYEANDNASDNKIVKTLLMYVLMIVPVYQVAGFLDIVVFNLIEFWSGSNPIAMEAGEMEEQLMTIKGETYKVTATQNKMSFVKLTNGEAIDMGAMTFDTDDNSWNFEKDGEAHKMASYDMASGNVSFFTETGVKVVDMQTVECLAMDKMNGSSSVAFASN